MKHHGMLNITFALPCPPIVSPVWCLDNQVSRSNHIYTNVNDSASAETTHFVQHMVSDARTTRYYTVKI